MPASARSLLDQALHLPEEQRADLAGRLILSLHPKATRGVEDAWAVEIDRRLDRFREGKAKSVPWRKVKQSLTKAQRARARRKALS